MQFASVAIWNLLSHFKAIAMSLNDVCVYTPAWFGVAATLATGLLASEVVGGSLRAAVGASLVMAIVPAHLMRSIAGAYDNESVAMTAMVISFFLWCRSLRTPSSWPIGILAGIAYAYMAATWGGYIFVGNMIALHAGFLVLLGRFSPHLHKAYSIWWIIGVTLASRIPVVGTNPFTSMEQLFPIIVFTGLQVLMFFHYWQFEWSRSYIRSLFYAGFIVTIPFAILIQIGWFGPLTARVRSLFLKHTLTGNPLVDSVAEHQPASAEAYWMFLNYALYLMPIGFVLAAAKSVSKRATRTYGVQVSKHFILLLTLVTYYFANRMNRLVLLMAPVASVLAGIALGFIVEWIINQFIALLAFSWNMINRFEEANEEEEDTQEHIMKSKKGRKPAPSTTNSSADSSVEEDDADDENYVYFVDRMFPEPLINVYKSFPGIFMRLLVAFLLAMWLARGAFKFWEFCDVYAQNGSQPSIMFQGQLRTGERQIIRDYYEAYLWLGSNTPSDSRVLAWWDYGYQITGIANRTSLADGNTWNLEHIATVGRMLALPEREAHKLVRQMADYVLVWAGNQGDDLAKSRHIARISNSVYADICPNDPLCNTFSIYRDGPTPSMAASLLYKLHSNGVQPGVTVDRNLFQEVYRSTYGLVRIYKVMDVDTAAKKWVMNPANRKCDSTGSWYCTGQYPPNFPVPPKTHRHLTYGEQGP